MKKVKPLHHKAMDLAEKAFAFKKEGNTEQAIQYFKAAYTLESEAALLIPAKEKHEPSRSVLFRSAGTMALHAGLLREAEKMVSQGLLGFPPKEVANELRELFDQITLKNKESTSTKPLGYMLKEARKLQGMTQEELAQKSGTTKSHISKIENNNSDIELSTLKKIIETGLGKHLEVRIS